MAKLSSTLSGSLSEEQLHSLDNLANDYDAIHIQDPDLWDEMKRETAVWQSLPILDMTRKNDSARP